MIPGVSDAALAAVDVPVFLGVGENDIVDGCDATFSRASIDRSKGECKVSQRGADHDHGSFPQYWPPVRLNSQ